MDCRVRGSGPPWLLGPSGVALSDCRVQTLGRSSEFPFGGGGGGLFCEGPAPMSQAGKVLEKNGPSPQPQPQPAPSPTPGLHAARIKLSTGLVHKALCGLRV